VLAHRVATDDSPEMREIRDNVILVLMPCLNPDGMNMVVDWYRRTLGTPYQDSPVPWLYQKYVGHDNNRDSYMQTQAETEVVNRLLYREWLPQIMYNQHQGTWPPRIFVPPFPDPVNPNIDPQVMRGVDLAPEVEVRSAVDSREEHVPPGRVDVVDIVRQAQSEAVTLRELPAQPMLVQEPGDRGHADVAAAVQLVQRPVLDRLRPVVVVLPGEELPEVVALH
jgi:hypothetical protein